MVRVQLLLTLFISAVFTIESKSQLQKTYGFESDDFGQVLLKASTNELYLIGAYGYIARIDTTGTIIWEEEIHQNDNNYFTILTDAVRTDSGFVLLGNSYDQGGNKENIFMCCINSMGDTLWTGSYGYPLFYCNANRLIKTMDRGYAIVGNGGDWSTRDLLVIKTDSAGNVKWSKTYGGDSGDYGISISETKSGNYIVAGKTNSFGEGGEDIYILKLDPSGDTIWTKTIGGNRNDYPSDIIANSSNDYILAGTTSSYGVYYHDDDFFISNINDEGEMMWSHTYGGNDNEEGQRLIESSDNNYLLIGNSRSFGFGKEDIFLVKINDSGDTIFTKAYGGPSTENGRCITESVNGYYLLGDTRSFSVGEKDMCIIQTDQNGISSCKSMPSSATISEPVWKEHRGSRTGYGCSQEPSDLHLENITIQINSMCDCIIPTAKFFPSSVDGWVNFTDLSTWPEDWSWDFGDGEFSDEQDPGHFIPEEQNVCLTVENSCGTATYCEIVYGGAGINETDHSSSVTIAPNPVKDFVEIELKNEIKMKSLRITTLSGHEVYKTNEINQNPFYINVRDLVKGLYFFEFRSDDDLTIIKKIIVE